MARKPKIAYLGPPGTFTEQALRTEQDLAKMEMVAFSRFTEVLTATSEGVTDFGFVAIENAIEGTVNITLDALAFDHDLVIQREVELAIELNLAAKPGTKTSEIETVLSHPVANAQCRKYLEKELPEATVRPANSTSEAAKIASESQGVAALTPSLAAERYGLETLSKNIADHEGNRTRFVLVGRSEIPKPTGHDKTTVVFTQREDAPGSLVAILQEFAARDINLTRLTSRPIKTSLGDYCFIADFNGHIGDEVVADCLKHILAKHSDIKFLGSYPNCSEIPGLRGDADTAKTQAESWMKALQARIS